MPKPKDFDEIMFARVAALARMTKKRYVVLSRGAWSERIIHGLADENNSQDFKGKLVDPRQPSNLGEEVTVGFYHPFFNGYAYKHSIVEVVKNSNDAIDDEYIAIGTGLQAIGAEWLCLDGDPDNFVPCAQIDPDAEVVCDSFVWSAGGGGYNGPALGTDDSYAFYDYLTMTHDMGPNEIPARVELLGYDGGPPPRPKFGGARLLFSWTPNWSAFQPTFQRCGMPGCDAGGLPDLANCCFFVFGWKQQYGDDWCAIVAAKIRSGEISYNKFSTCGWLYDWIVNHC